MTAPAVRMTEATRRAAEAIAGFLADNQGRMRVGSIAELASCPIRPPKEDLDRYRYNVHAVVGAEPHCRRVKAALEAAVKLGLVQKVRPGPAGRGPWYYSATETARQVTP